MIRMRLGASALADLRFAISPLTEAMLSVGVLADPGAQALHLPWVTWARQQTADIDVSMLRALQPAGVDTPDFVNPPPSGPLTELEEELSVMSATPPAEARAEIQWAYRGRPIPTVLTPFIEDPATAIAGLAELLRVYWERTLAQHWPRVRGLLEGDVLYRARQMADGGARRLFADIDPTVRWADGELRIDKRAEARLDIGDTGLLFVPSVFVWPAVVALTAAPWQPTIIYPARGVGALWEPVHPASPAALGALLGRSRANILIALESPRSTSDLARAVGLTAGGASQHLAVLRGAGLVHGHRVGRVVLNVRSPVGDSLLCALPAED